MSNLNLFLILQFLFNVFLYISCKTFANLAIFLKEICSDNIREHSKVGLLLHFGLARTQKAAHLITLHCPLPV